MRAAVITAPEKSPVYASFAEPPAGDGLERIIVAASALSRFSKSRSAGSHYSSESVFPSIPGVDGVGRTADGRRVYFVLPEAPYGALAEQSLVEAARCIPLPDTLDDVSAAAIANPGMSAWAALMERARLQPGETVLIHGATGSAGRLAVQLAKHLGAGKVIAAGRAGSDLQGTLSLGADMAIPIDADFERRLMAEFAHGIDVVVDYLWGESARSIIGAIAVAVEEAVPVRYLQVGAASGAENIELPATALRSSAIQLMGSGIKSVPFARLLDAVRNVFEIAETAKLQIATKTMPLSEIAEAWRAPGKPRIVVTME